MVMFCAGKNLSTLYPLQSYTASAIAFSHNKTNEFQKIIEMIDMALFRMTCHLILFVLLWENAIALAV